MQRLGVFLSGLFFPSTDPFDDKSIPFTYQTLCNFIELNDYILLEAL